MKQQERQAAPAVFDHGRLFEGDSSRLPSGVRVAIVVSRYNAAVTEQMLAGAARTLAAAGLDRYRLDVARVPGAFELPIAADRLAATGEYAAVICLGLRSNLVAISGAILIPGTGAPPIQSR